MSCGFPMIRNTASLRGAEVDLLVVGGGIYGAWSAYDAAQRGLRVALIERNDWGCGTSGASSKLIHGGLRYLEHFEFKLVRHSLAERRVLSRIAPHLVRPLRFLVPVWADSRLSRVQLAAGLTLYDLLAGHSSPAPKRRRYPLSQLRQEYSKLRQDGLRGAYAYGDCQEDDARVTLVVAAAAQGAGAVCASRVSAQSLSPGDRGVRVELQDMESGDGFALHARCVVNAAGPWASALMGRSAPAVRLVKGVHLVLPGVPQPDIPEAFLLTAPQDGRVYFVIPWYGRTLVGTTESQLTEPSEPCITEAEQAYLLEAVAHAFPGLNWGPDDVLGRFAGVRTLQAEDAENLSAVSREFVITRPAARVIQPIGGKYTTARYDAAQIVDAVERELGRSPTPARTGAELLPHAPLDEYAVWQADAQRRLRAVGVDAEAAAQVCQRHGRAITRMAALIAEKPQLGRRLHPDLAFIGVELEHGVRDEMARSAVDLLRRRVPLMLLARPCAPAIEAAVDALARNLGWDEARCQSERASAAAAWAAVGELAS